MDIATILGFCGLLFFVALFIIFRKSIVSVLVDVAWGFAFYVVILIVLGLFSIRIPIGIIFWGFPITVVAVIIIHLYNSASQPNQIPIS